jgi:HEAT repeat protein
MNDKCNLLDDNQVGHFVMNGYVQVKTELDDEVHRAAHEKTKRAFGAIHDLDTDRNLNPGNNILPMVPELADVLEDPNVVGALTSLLGKNYLIHPHRHCHPNFPVSQDGTRTTIMGIHKDGHADGNPKPRHRYPRWALLFYNPHPCPDTLGPTCITPGSHYYHRIVTHGERERNVSLTGHKNGYLLPENYVNRHFMPVESTLGVVSILHFDTVHSVTTNLGDLDRYAHKFVIMRTENPHAPSWNGESPLWNQADIGDHQNHEIMWTYMWNWMNGRENLYENSHQPRTDAKTISRWLRSASSLERLAAANEIGFVGEEAASFVPELVGLLDDPSDSVRLNAAYALGSTGISAVGPLVDSMESGDQFFAEHPILNIGDAAHALAAVGAPAVNALAEGLSSNKEHFRAWSAFALGEIGSPARRVIPELLRALQDESQAVRRHVISALGMIGRGETRIEDSLLSVFTGLEESDLRIYALQGLIRLDAAGDETLAALTKALSDPHPYIAAFAAELLFRNGGPEGHNALLEYLRPLRWFPAAIR